MSANQVNLVEKTILKIEFESKPTYCRLFGPYNPTSFKVGSAKLLLLSAGKSILQLGNRYGILLSTLMDFLAS